MKCCASPTISTVPSRAVDATSPARAVAAEFEAMLIAQAFKPLAAALGFYGDAAVAAAARAIARSEHGGLTDRLESAFE